MSQKSKPRAVLISDIHFNLNNKNLASAALRAAVEKSMELKIPLIIAGDLNDTKAIIRAECLNEIISILQNTNQEVFVLIGNHDQVHEKSKEHSLNFLRPYANVIESPIDYLGLWFVPYQTDLNALRDVLSDIPKGSTLIMHQGLRTAYMGEYVRDDSSIDPSELKDFRCVSGHYHRHQHIVCDNKKHSSYGELGVFSYIGTPYTTSFAEANDGPKGIQILHTDGRLEQVPLNLRKHVVVERSYEDVLGCIEGLMPEDLLWLKVNGPASELDKLNKKEIGLAHLGHQNFKLDKIYWEVEKKDSIQLSSLPDDQILDKVIDESEETKDQKTYLKNLWREILK